MQNSKVRLITPFLMLFAGALAAIIMYIKEYEFYRMLWVLLIVLIVFYIIGDIARYLYASAMPRVIPAENYEAVVASMMEKVVAKPDAEKAHEEEIAEEVKENTEPIEEMEETSEYDMDEEESMDEESVEEYTDENLDEM